MPWHSRRIALSTLWARPAMYPSQSAFHNPRRRVLAHPKRSSEANVPLFPTGAELLFEVFSQRYEQGSILVTTNLTFDEWTEGLRLGKANWRAAGPAHPPRPLPGDERRKLPPQAQQGNRRLASSRRSRGRIGRTVNAVSTCSLTSPLRPIYCHQSSRQWYTITPPQWPNISAPLTAPVQSVKPV